MHVTGPQENRFFASKKTKFPILVDTNLGDLILEQQTVDTRSTSGLPLKTLKTWGYDGSN